MRKSILVTAVAVMSGALSGCGGEAKSATSSLPASEQKDYAERVYQTYADASNGALQISVTTRGAGTLADLADSRFEDLLGAPTKVMKARSIGNQILSAEMADAAPEHELFYKDQKISGFELNGRALQGATYRLLDVAVTTNGALANHAALEASFSDGSSIVVDLVMQRVDTFAQVHKSLAETGWTLVREVLPATGEQSLTGTNTSSATRVCALARNHGWGSYSLTWASYHDWWSNVFGMHLVDFYMGKQQTGVACAIRGSSCVPDAFGTSSASSCGTILNYSCACKNSGLTVGSTGNRMAVASETECTYKGPLSANASVSYSKNGVGANFSLAWDSHGAAADDFNGGEQVDTCGWY